eukprot:6607209-Karenia_brevis.AAC.1
MPDEHDEPASSDEHVVHALSSWSNATQAVPLNAQADVEAEANQWACMWQEGYEYLCCFEADEKPAVEHISAHQLRKAALTFPPETGVGCENIAPRAFARLSDKTLSCLGSLLQS